MKQLMPLAVSTALLAVSCGLIFPDMSEDGTLAISFDSGYFVHTRAVTEIPDTNDFILTVTDSKGKTVYEGDFGACPEHLEVSPGEYCVTAVSSSFHAPAFDSPQYGDTQSARVYASDVTDVRLICRQMNCGVKLRVSPDFLTAYPKGILFLKSEDGRLMYSYSEKRIAYFRPGRVSLILNDDDSEQTLLSRSLASQEILSVNVGVTPQALPDGVPGARLSILVDTTRVWLDEDYVIGGEEDAGTTPKTAFSVSKAREHIGALGVWVYGYIVGGDLSSTGISFSGPFESPTNLAISTRSVATEKSSCMSVQLPKGSIRDELNLSSHPSFLGKAVCLKGNIVESYFGIPGVQNITEWQWR